MAEVREDSLMCCAGASLLLLVLAGGQEPNRAQVQGRFLDAQGQPVAGALVLSRVWPGAEFPVRSSPDGRFEALVEWPADRFQARYECGTRLFGSALWRFQGELVPDQELDLGTVRLAPGGAVSGRVLLGSEPAGGAWILVAEAGSMPPVPGRRLEGGAPLGHALGPACVSVHGERRSCPWPVDRGSSAADGGFRIVGLPPGRYGIWARSEASYWAATSAFEVAAARETI